MDLSRLIYEVQTENVCVLAMIGTTDVLRRESKTQPAYKHFQLKDCLN